MRRVGHIGAVAFVVVGMLLDGATSVRAQLPVQTSGQQRCDLMENQFVRSIVTGDGDRITYISGPVLFVCQDSTRIRADSVVEFTRDQFRELMGHVDIDGPQTRVRADRVHLFTGSGRTQAWGHVRATAKESDTRMVGDTLVFLQAGGGRAKDRLRIWGGRPYAVLRLEGQEAPDTASKETGPQVVVIGGPKPAEPVDTMATEPKDTLPKEPPPPPPPDTVFGDRLYMQGRTRFLAGGAVRIERPDLTAVGDSLDYDRDLGRARLLATDSVPATIDGQKYDLQGRYLSLLIQGSRVSRVDAEHRARLTGEDVQVEAPRIAVFLSEGEISRMVAMKARSSVAKGAEGEGGAPAPAATDSTRAAPEPEATAEDFSLRADSIEVRAPEQRLDEVIAVGGARGETRGRDSLNTPQTPEIIRHDWIEGDTVQAHFLPPDSTPGTQDAQLPDSVQERSRLDRLVASGHARSLYRVANDSTVRDSSATARADSSGAPAPDTARSVQASDSAGTGVHPERRLAVHYVVGDRITIVLHEGEVQRMEVEGQTRGLYLEPGTGAPSPVLRPDTTESDATGPPASASAVAAGKGGTP